MRKKQKDRDSHMGNNHCIVSVSLGFVQKVDKKDNGDVLYMLDKAGINQIDNCGRILK